MNTTKDDRRIDAFEEYAKHREDEDAIWIVRRLRELAAGNLQMRVLIEFHKSAFDRCTEELRASQAECEKIEHQRRRLSSCLTGAEADLGVVANERDAARAQLAEAVDLLDRHISNRYDRMQNLEADTRTFIATVKP